MKFKTLVYFGIVIFLLLNIIVFTLDINYFYPMTIKNCNEILSANYLTPTEEYSDCVTFIKYPFYNYWLESIIAIPILMGLSSLIISFIAWGIREEFGDGWE